MADELHIHEIEEQAALYALGALADDEAARFELRLRSGCQLCQSEVRMCNEIITALPLSAAEVTPPPRLRARVLEMARAAESAEKDPKTAMAEGTIVRANETEWSSNPRMPGVQFRKLYENKTMLVKMARRTSLPAHQHNDAAEQCLVLEGSITSDGVTAYAGDFTYMPKGSSHQPLYSEDGCLLLIAYT